MSLSVRETAYTLVYDPNPNFARNTASEFQKALEKGSDEQKVETMKRVLVTMLDGNPMPELLMHVIRFVMPSKNKQLKKLLYFYWEIVPKLDDEGKLRQEMILVCNAIQHDLQHSNEYIRGSTLRFLTKLKEADLLEQMVPAVRTCLEYRHAYVRKYAILAVGSIYKVSEHLIPDARDVIDTFLAAETDPICKRNAFLGLSELDREAALSYLQEHITAIETLDPLLQDAFVDFIRKDAVRTPTLKPQYIDLLQDLLASTNSNEVVFEAALAVSVLTNDPLILAEVASKLIDLAVKESDNNVKLIVLQRIQDIHKRAMGDLERLTLDILRVLSAQDLDVRAKALEISLELVSSRNVDDVVKLLKKELQKAVADSQNDEKASDYRQLLINNIHKVAISFVEVSAEVVSLLLEFIGDLSSTAASGVISFIKDVIERYPKLRKEVLQHLIGALPYVNSGKAYRGALWILGEYALDKDDVQNSWKHIRQSIGEVPIVQTELRSTTGGQDEARELQDVPTGPVVLPDGTYATESAFTATSTKAFTKEEKDSRPPLRRFILNGDFYTASVLASTLVKLVLRFEKGNHDEAIINAMKAEGMLILVSILRAGQSSLVQKKIDEDSAERVLTAISIIMGNFDANQETQERELLELAFLKATRSSFEEQAAIAKRVKAKKFASLAVKSAEPIDKAIVFRQFSQQDVHNTPVDQVDEDLEMAITGGTSAAYQEAVSLESKLKKIVPLTGFSDPVYAEAYITTHQFDIVLDVLLVNQTKETLKNLHCQFATLGDLKIIDNPPSTNVVAHGFHKISITVKVSSADTGVIFGNIIYDGGHGQDARYVIMNDVHVDIMDYIKPAFTDEANFRKMWNAFEWENKITVRSKLPTLHAYLKELMKGTKMGNLTRDAPSKDEEECRFLSCNLYSRSSFGEDALANLCIEKDLETGEVVGHVRIRSKGQGLALSLGDRVALIARQINKVKLDRV